MAGLMDFWIFGLVVAILGSEPESLGDPGREPRQGTGQK